MLKAAVWAGVFFGLGAPCMMITQAISKGVGPMSMGGAWGFSFFQFAIAAGVFSLATWVSKKVGQQNGPPKCQVPISNNILHR